MLIDNEIKDLVQEIAEGSSDPDACTKSLIQKLTTACNEPENRMRYDAYKNADSVLEAYPLDSDGYAVSFDPLHDEKEFYETWSRYGFVVGKDIIGKQQCNKTIDRIGTIFSDMTNGKGDIFDARTYDAMPVDANGTPLLSRGFFEIYHDDSLAQLRQNISNYIHHVVIWGRTDLWTTFDRIGIKPPHHEQAAGLKLHVDQNPLVHAYFKTLQGVLALTDCPKERGTFCAVPGSKKYFGEYGKMAKNKGEYVELDASYALSQQIISFAQPIPLRAGNLVSWDSRTTHANTSNISDDTRIVAYISAGPANEQSADAVQARKDALQTGFGSNVREALMHASMKPRFTDGDAIAKIRQPEQFTLLGKLLYGMESYGKITSPTFA